MKEKLQAIIEENTQEFVLSQKREKLTANELADKLNQKRNTVSKYLNQLWEQGVFIKINTRPVLFMSRKILKDAGYLVETASVETISDLKKLEENTFMKLIGINGSLQSAIQQIETATMYPDNGLAFILFGPSGSGKSYIAKLSHQYAISQRCLSEEAPFVVLNCAQYADNPELLSSLLFGHVKGAFTGAEEEKEGLLAAADGGILFLDEVHRLSPESQEKLFIFMDKGTYTPLGAVKETKKANVRLIFATTEKREKFLLTTFIRRIPIQIELPNLHQRSERERLELIYTFFQEESVILDTTLSISSRVIQVLMHYQFAGNVGELKNTIKYLCAFQYRKMDRKRQLIINTSLLPEEIYALVEEENTISPVKNILISPNTLIRELEGLGKSKDASKIDKLFEEILSLFQLYEEELTSNEFLKKALLKVDLMMDSFVFDKMSENNRMLLQMINRKVKSIMNFLEEDYHLTIFKNGAFYISSYLFYRMQQNYLENEHESKFAKLKQFLMNSYNEAYENAKNLIFLLENKLDIFLNTKDEILLTFYLISTDLQQREEQRSKVLILAHGFATASSLANVGNRLLNQQIFEAFDMSLESTAIEIGQKVDEYIQKNRDNEEFIFLVDMGSLQEIERYIHPRDSIFIGIVNNVTTSMVLSVGQMIINKMDPKTLIDTIQAEQQIETKFYLPKNKTRRIIITTCMTGIGTADQIRKLIENSLEEDYNIEVFSMNYYSLKHNGIGPSISPEEVITIIGTDNPHINNIPYIPLEKLISGEDGTFTTVMSDVLTKEETEQLNRKIIKNFSLDKVIESITILESRTVINEIEKILAQFEVLFNRKIENKIQMTLYVHIACLIERLIRNQAINEYPEESFNEIPTNVLDAIRRVLSGIENKYSVTIPPSELGYLYSILFEYQ
ncbi:sigma 54-interacting transcriptional regulator [Enterococcus saccharolyticus]|uniref:sigma 54-interacting transcriptional regulator n=1 Tax=Enterococcus saccharolyticus TaxID=41997 RepID=UPI001E63175F|nr:sigma-54-dependent transcriptional regulator [Enterococcus saccharolyticus]MCD5001960.1 sigma 54-interacting transcriptional regulator [Enterococcus saccharolyticus]